VALADLRERAASASVPHSAEKLPLCDGPTLVAGRAIDLSGHLDCLDWDCVQKQVEVLFNHVWHYFDRVVVVGPSPHEISSSLNNHEMPIHLLTYIRLLLYLREIGAQELLLFRQKRPPCQLHLMQHLREVGIESLEEQTESLVPRLADEAKIQVAPHDGHTDYAFSHPQFEHTVWDAVAPGAESDLRGAIARAVVRKYLAALASDLHAARTLSCPLGSTIRFHGCLMTGGGAGSPTDQVAFELELPVVKGLDLRTLLKIRRDEKLSFERFRRALVTAIKDRLATGVHVDAKKIAREICKDVLEPALAEIESRLKGTTKSLRGKGAATLAISSIPAIYGLHSASPLLIAAGLTPAVNSLTNAVHRYIEERRDVALSDMFFLWQAQRHAERRAA
jgi:hypothetical protein